MRKLLALALCTMAVVRVVGKEEPRIMHVFENVDLQAADHNALRENRNLGSPDVPEDYIVRVQQHGTPTIYQDLKKIAAGGFVKYMPQDTYVVALFGGQIDTVLSIPGVEGVFLIPSEGKIAPRNRTRSRPNRQNNPAPVIPQAMGNSEGRIVNAPRFQESTETSNGNRRSDHKVIIDCLIGITEITGSSFEPVLAQWISALQHETVGGLGLEVEWPSFDKIVVFTLASKEDAVVTWLSNQPLVFWIEERPVYSIKNKFAVKAIQSTTGLSLNIWEKGLRGENEIIGCADTGLDYDGCHFYDPNEQVAVCEGFGAVSGCSNPNHRKIISYRYFQDLSDDSDGVGGHGTHVAGSIAGNAGGGFDGAAPAAKIAFDDISITDAGGAEALNLPSNLNTQLLPHSYSVGARIHSNSWGSDWSQYDIFSKEMDEFIADHDDFLVLVAAGNSGPDLNSVGSPATAKNVLSVGAGQNTREAYEDIGIDAEAEGLGKDNLADFSSRGPTSDGRFKPDVVCPGDTIWSAYSDGQLNSGDQCYIIGMSGTSMATPLCAGSASLVRQYFKEGFLAAGMQDLSQGFEPSAALVKAMMIHSGQKMYYQAPDGSWQWPTSLPIIELGYGRVDLSTVLWFGEESTFKLRVFDRQLVSASLPDQEFEFVVADSSQDFKVSLVWTDAAGVPMSSRALVQNLDLRCTDPSGTVRYGNGFVDDINNNEQVTISNPEPGVHKVVISAVDLPYGAQAFSLVVTGALDTPTSPQTSTPAETTAAPSTSSTTAEPTTSSTTAAPTSSSTTAEPTTSSSTAAPSTSSTTTQAPTTSSSSTPRPTTSSSTPAPTTTSSSTTPAPTTTSQAATTTSSSTAAPSTSSFADATTTAEEQPETTTELPATTSSEEPENPTTTTPLPQECQWTDVAGSPFSGALGSFSVSAASGTARVDFSSDEAGTQSGFLALYGPDTETVESTCDSDGTLREAFGVVSDGPGRYSNNADCQWIIAPEGATSVTVVFESFQLERNYDFLRVFKCTEEGCGSNDRVSLGVYTGGNIPQILFADTPAMLIQFQSDYSITKAGFRAWYAGSGISDCPSDRMTLPASVPSGFIRDSANPSYSNSQSCGWDIEVGEAGLRLTFLEFNTEADGDLLRVKTCEGGEAPAPTTTEAVDPPETTSAMDPPETTTAEEQPTSTPEVPTSTPVPDVGDECTAFEPVSGSPFSGTSLPAAVTSSAVHVDFQSDGSFVSEGFLAVYKPTVEPPSSTCESAGLLTGSWGEISDGAGNYLSNQECEWIISSATGSVTLYFESFAFEYGYDFLYIDACADEDCENFQPHPNSPWTGTSSPGFVASTTPYLRIRMTSDFSIVRDGFQLVYTTTPLTECVPDGVILQDEAGFISEGLGPYNNGQHCTWEIHALPGAQVQVQFLELNTEQNWDWVSVQACSSGSRRSSEMLPSGTKPESKQLSAVKLKPKLGTIKNLAVAFEEKPAAKKQDAKKVTLLNPSIGSSAARENEGSSQKASRVRENVALLKGLPS